MRVPFYRSLDRSVDIFGLKGLWIIVFLALAGASVLAGLVVGMMMGTGMGLAAILLLAGVSFMFCVTTQGRLPAKRLKRFTRSGQCSVLVRRRETLSRILLDDEAYAAKTDADETSRKAIDTFFED